MDNLTLFLLVGCITLLVVVIALAYNLSNFKNQNEDLTKKVQKLKMFADNAKDKYDAVVVERDMAIEQVTPLKQHVEGYTELKREYVELQGAHRESSEKLIKTEGELYNKQNELANMRIELERYEEKVNSITSIEEKLSSMSEEKNKLELELLDVKKDNERLIAEKDFLDKNNKTLEENILILKERNEIDNKLENIINSVSQNSKDISLGFNEVKDVREYFQGAVRNINRVLDMDVEISSNMSDIQLENMFKASGLIIDKDYIINSIGEYPRCMLNIGDNKLIFIDVFNHHEIYQNILESEAPDDVKMNRIMLSQKLRESVDFINDQKYSEDQSFYGASLIFVGNDQALLNAVYEDSGLHEYAISKSVFIVSPSTFMMVMKSVKLLWDFNHKKARADEILEGLKDTSNTHSNIKSGISEGYTKIEELRELYFKIMSDADKQSVKFEQISKLTES